MQPIGELKCRMNAADATTALSAVSKQDSIRFDDFAWIGRNSKIQSLWEPRVPGTGHLRFRMGLRVQTVSL